jgi:hypothetical protein
LDVLLGLLDEEKLKYEEERVLEGEIGDETAEGLSEEVPVGYKSQGG